MKDTILRQLLLLAEPLGFVWLMLLLLTALLWRSGSAGLLQPRQHWPCSSRSPEAPRCRADLWRSWSAPTPMFD
jgi:hypothetical protein